jgi:hypothetical protein
LKIEHTKVDHPPESLVEDTRRRAARDEPGARDLLSLLHKDCSKHDAKYYRPVDLFTHSVKFKKERDAVFFRISWR